METKEGITKGSHIKFKHGKIWLYGIIDIVKDGYCEVSYGTKKIFEGFLKRDNNLDNFCDVDNNCMELLTSKSIK